MPVYEYHGYDTAGKKATGVVDAETPQSARGKLRIEGVLITRLSENSERSEFIRNPAATLFNRISAKDIATFTRQLATLTEGGLTLIESLDALIEQTVNPRFKKVITDIRATVLQGGAMATALAAHPAHFDPLYVNLVRAGEAAGSLGETLHRLANFHENRIRQIAKVTTAMLYPMLMTLVGSAALLFLFTYVMPQVLVMFEDMRAALPLATLILIFISDFLSAWWEAIIIALVLVLYGFDRYRKTRKGKEVIDRVTLSIPVIGELVRVAAISRFARSMGTLLTGGVALIESLKVTSAIVDHAQLSAAIDQAIINITEGEAITTPLKKSGLFPPMVTQMIAAGERSGSLPAMLEKIADGYEFEVENALAALTALVEPLLILCMGGVVGFIVMAILLPILELSQIAQ